MKVDIYLKIQLIKKYENRQIPQQKCAFFYEMMR